MTPADSFSPACPLPLRDHPTIQLAHGGGGSLMNRLIREAFLPAFDNPWLRAGHDGAVVEPGSPRIAVTTDGYVVHPLFFPGGDIGSMAVNGTVNDLAMCGARPQFLTAGFILEEGLPMETLWRVIQSMRAAAREAGVAVVAGDTKVVDRGKADGLYITTAGVGRLETEAPIRPDAVREGDRVLLSGDLGRHGIAIMAVREGLEFEGAIESDCAPLAVPVLELLEAGVAVHCLRDLTRGGLAAAVVEIADTAGIGIALDAPAIPVRDEVRGACEILGLDPLYVANEGRFIAIVEAGDADRALDILRGHDPAAAGIGTVQTGRDACVTICNELGVARIVDLPSGEQLPRIC